MLTSSLRRIALPLLAACFVAGVLGCGSETTTSSPEMPTVRALRFAGVDLDYALERVATEAGVPLALDQIRGVDNAPDLGLYRVDVDLPAGPLDDVMRKLKESAGGIDFEIAEGVLYVRSSLLVTTKTPFDVPMLPKSSFKGTMADLINYIQNTIPSSYLVFERIYGNPEPPSVEFEIAEKASIKDVFLQYARASKLGFAMYRAGQEIKDPTHGNAVVGSAIQVRYPRATTSRRPQVFNLMSTTGALASASARLGVPLVVLDRSVMMNTRGFLNLSSQKEQKLPLKEDLDELAESGWGPEQWHFKWKTEDGVPVIESRDYLSRLAGRDLFHAEVLAGEFEGSLPEFVRWANSHVKKSTNEVLMGGEITEGMPRAKITIAPGTTLQQALVAFAKGSGVSVYVALLGSTNPLSGKLISHPNAWHGAFVQDLSEWLPTEADYQRATGYYPDAP